MLSSAKSIPLLSQDCVYHLLDGGINEFVFLKASGAAVDAWADQWEQIHLAAAPGEMLYALIDTGQSGLPPVNHMLRRSRQLMVQMPDRPKSRTAILTSNRVFLSIVQELSRPLLQNHLAVVQYFPVNQRDAALAWLKAEL